MLRLPSEEMSRFCGAGLSSSREIGGSCGRGVTGPGTVRLALGSIIGDFFHIFMLTLRNMYGILTTIRSTPGYLCAMGRSHTTTSLARVNSMSGLTSPRRRADMAKHLTLIVLSVLLFFRRKHDTPESPNLGHSCPFDSAKSARNGA